MRLFGTDGIRGKITVGPTTDIEAITALFEKREISPRLFRLIGEGLGATLGADSEVVVGWDPRPGNSNLVSSLTQGFNLRGVNVIWAGEVATPGLQASMLSRGAAMGCMITASHNPVSDSGIKVFDKYGFKSMPDFEDNVSEIITSLANEEREIDEPELAILAQPNDQFDGGSVHLELLDKRFKIINSCFSKGRAKSSIPDDGIAIDTSGGTAQRWLIDWLNNRGINAYSAGVTATLNENCGAGGLEPTDKWTWEEISKGTEHLLLDCLAKKCIGGLPNEWEIGSIVGAALDGDGDRCLFIEATNQGLQVIDGDRIANAIIRSANGTWKLAASIETDLGLEVDFQTAVGDRWLAAALAQSVESEGLLQSENIPMIIGSEDSGHIVLSAPHPNLSNNWSLVGDGVVTLLATLAADRALGGLIEGGFRQGWKRRISVKDVDRSKWDGKNSISDEIENVALGSVSKWGDVGNWRRTSIEGETSLLLIEADVRGHYLSIGIRNSGTENKTNISIRLSPELHRFEEMAMELLCLVETLLATHLKPMNRSWDDG